MIIFTLSTRHSAGNESVLTCSAALNQEEVCSELRDAAVQLSRSLKPFFKFPSSFSAVQGREREREGGLRMRGAPSADPAGERVARMRSAVEEPRGACAARMKSKAQLLRL